MDKLFNINEMLRRLFKYIFMFVLMSITLWFIPTIQLNGTEITICALIATSIYSILDTTMPCSV